MQTVTFKREFRHVLPGHRTAIYPAGAELSVSAEVFEAAKLARAIKTTKPKEETDGPSAAD